MKINDRILTVWWLFIVAIYALHIHCMAVNLFWTLFFFIHFIFIASFWMVIKLCNSHGFRFFDIFFTWTTQKKNELLIYRLCMFDHTASQLSFFFIFVLFLKIPFVQKAFQLRRSFVMHALLIWYSHLFCISCCDSFCIFLYNNRYNSFSCALNGILLLLLTENERTKKKPLLKQWYVILAFDTNVSKFKLKVIGGYFSHNGIKSNLSQNLLNEPRFRNNLTITKSAYCSFYISLYVVRGPWSVVRLFDFLFCLYHQAFQINWTKTYPKIQKQEPLRAF